MSRASGEDHIDTLTAKAHLAATYCNQGRWDEAAKLELQVVEARVSILGKNHPSTLIAMANLASTYGRQGRLRDAKSLFANVKRLSSDLSRQPIR
jgi:hypothetical protein